MGEENMVDQSHIDDIDSHDWKSHWIVLYIWNSVNLNIDE